MSSDSNTLAPIHDALDGVLQPFQHGTFVGQDAAMETFLRSASGGRLHHAWLLTGPRGVGRATFAYRIARALVENPDSEIDLSAHLIDRANDKLSPEFSGVFSRVAQGAHPNILHLRIPFDEKSKKFKSVITIDEVRKTVPFFGATSGTKGWRVAIIDSADDLNRDASNSLLKILEEPPYKTVFFIISSSLNKVLPTIKSRTRHLSFSGLEEAHLSEIGSVVFDNFDPEMTNIATQQAEGSARQMLELLLGEGTEIISGFHKLVQQLPQLNESELQAYGDRLNGVTNQPAFRAFVKTALKYIHQCMQNPTAHLSARNLWADTWQDVSEIASSAEIYNLDRKQACASIFSKLGETQRALG